MKLTKQFIIFMVIWISGCALQEYVFQIEHYAYIMAWGGVVAILAGTISKLGE